jgi:hypothetical protein
LGFLFCFLFFVFFGLSVLFFCFCPLWWDKDQTTSETLSPGLESKGLTAKLLRLKLYCIWTWELFFNPLTCLSNACLAHCWLVHYLSLFISLALFFSLIVYLFVFSTVCLFFPFSLPPLLSLSSHPSILDITIVIITSKTILNYTQYRDSNNSKENDGKMEKKGKSVSPK